MAVVTQQVVTQQAAAPGYRPHGTFRFRTEARRQLARRRTQFALGFMVLLLLTILLATLGLVRVTDAGGAAFAVAVIVGGGFLFYKLIRVLSRIQMPRPPSH